MLKLLLTVLLLGLFGPAAPNPVPAAHPPLWKVSDGDTTLYLFGSIHVLRGQYDWFQGPVRRAFEQSDALVLELAPGQDRAIQRAAEKLGSLPPGTRLPNLLPVEEGDLLRSRLIQGGLPVDTFDRYAPWRAMLALSTEPLARAGYSPHYGVENVLTKQARYRGKPISGLETAVFQFSRFAAIPRDKQVQMLAGVLHHPDQPLDTANRLTTLWAKGDVPGLHKAISADLAASPAEVAPLLILSRNRDWTRRIEARMARPGTIFIAVGLGHLAGPQSVVERLRHAGYRVERLQ